MYKKQVIIIIILLTTLITGCQKININNQNNQDENIVKDDVTYLPLLSDKYMKGYELYSWEDNGTWYFALLVGTDRLKTTSEVKDEAVRLESVERLLTELGYLQQGENIFWSGTRVEGTALPPEQVINRVSDYCTSKGIQLVIER